MPNASTARLDTVFRFEVLLAIGKFDVGAGFEAGMSIVFLAVIADRLDIGIRYGTGRWRGFTAELLGHTEVLPVCAPFYLAERGPFAAPGALLGERLPFLDDPRRYWIDWPACSDRSLRV